MTISSRVIAWGSDDEENQKSQRPHGCDGGEGAANEKNERQAA